MLWEAEVDLGKMSLAVELARGATRARPAAIGNWAVLGRSLICLGRWDEAAECLRRAVSVLPPSVELEIVLAEALLGLDLFEEALPHAENAIGLAPANSVAKRVHLAVLAALRRPPMAYLDPDALAVAASSNPVLMEMRVQALGPEEGLNFCNRQLAADPSHTNAKYLKAITLATLGHAEEARNLVALDRLIEVTRLEPPDGYSNDQAFRDSLAAEIRANPTLSRDHRNKAARDGRRTRFLRQLGAVATDALLRRIRQAVEAYIRRLTDSADVFLSGSPQRVRVQAWAIVCDATGRQKAHRHPDGWLSGVYYVSAPRSRRGDTWSGPLLLGALDDGELNGELNGEPGVVPPWGVREIEPEPGRLVLFPSYVPHATCPSGVDGARICVAFDIVPVVQTAAATYWAAGVDSAADSASV